MSQVFYEIRNKTFLNNAGNYLINYNRNAFKSKIFFVIKRIDLIFSIKVIYYSKTFLFNRLN